LVSVWIYWPLEPGLDDDSGQRCRMEVSPIF